MNDKKFKIIFSCTFLMLGILRIFFDWFQKRIDVTTIALFLIAFLPWLARYLKSLEAFGIKASFNIPEEKKKKIDKMTEKIENSNKKIKEKEEKKRLDLIDDIYEFSDENTRFVLIRYEIERELKILCNKNGIDSFRMNMRYLVDSLCKKDAISNDIANLIFDILPYLNNAVHSNNVKMNPNDLEWVNEKGISIIMYLRSLSNK